MATDRRTTRRPTQSDTDRLRFATGAGRSLADLPHDGTLHAVFLRAPFAHAAIERIDTAATQAMPGVVAILTGADCTAAGFGNFRGAMRYRGEGDNPLVVPFRPVLAQDVVRDVGEAVACIVADGRTAAEDAAEAIEVGYTPRQAVIGLDAAQDPASPAVHAAAPGNLAIDFHREGRGRAPTGPRQGDAGPTSANRLLSYARAAYGWTVERQLLSANPFDRLEAPGATRARDRVLNMTEVGAIWRAAAVLPAVYRNLVRVLLLTCARRDEAASMQWTELSSDLMRWTLPAERSKNGRAHVAHLAEATREILAARPRIPECPYVFPGKGEKRPVSAFNYAKRKLDEQIAKVRSEAELEPAELPGWTLHDFRRTAVTTLAQMDFAPHVCDRLLNHITGSIQGVAAVYQRAKFAGERKAALIAWADAVMGAVEGKPSKSNVVPLLGRSAAA